MIPELVNFVILLVVFILAYGLASQALINPAQVIVIGCAVVFVFGCICICLYLYCGVKMFWGKKNQILLL